MNYAKAEIITIGDEILYGHILDTNSQWICQELDAIGVKVQHRITLGDHREDIIEAFETAWKRADIILVTGGLGPTDDDITKPCLVEFFGTELEIHQEALEKLTEFFKLRGKGLTETNRMQAAVPIGAEMLENKMGTAPGLLFPKDGKILVSMPGVPIEMKYLMNKWVFPRIKEDFELPVIFHKTLKMVGIGESFLADKLKPWAKGFPETTSLAYLPSLGMVKLRLTTVAEDISKAQVQTEKLIEEMLPLGGKYIYGYNNDTLEGKIGEILKEKKLSLSAAESCTGGYFSHMITSVPGSSDYFKGSIVSYDNSVKENLLNVPSSVIEKYGAVSEEVVKIMAEEVRKKLKTDIGVSVSGIAGPGGGSEDKPVGTVWICYCDDEKTITKILNLGFRNRTRNVQLSTLALLNLIRLQLTGVIREKETKL